MLTYILEAIEMWKQIIIDDIPTNYEINELGEVQNSTTGLILKQFEQLGYMHVTIRVNHKPKRVRVHRLGANAFIPNPNHKPEVNHIDSDKSNNQVENLEWVDNSENKFHAYTFGTR